MWFARHIGRERCTVTFPRIPTKQRPRFDGRSHRTYTPKDTTVWEDVIANAWREQVGERWKGFEGEVRMLVLVELALAKSDRRRDVGRALLMTPDADNTMKLCGDGLEGVAYRNDRQITRACVVKLPRVPFLSFGEDRCRIRIRCDYYQERYEKE